MTMRLLQYTALLALLGPPVLSQKSDKDEEAPLEPCTIKSPRGSFFDINPISVRLPEDGKKPERNESWHAQGYDYGANFTINFCAPVVEKIHEGQLVGVNDTLTKNISAFYEKDGEHYSIGRMNNELVFRGRKLVLNYTDGSSCPDSDGGSSSHRRKSTIISLLCERDPLASKVSLAFVGASPDDCTYFFEARTFAACATVNLSKEQLSPSGVFGVIAAIAIIVYFVGGIVYQRAVMHQRGWRQLPNYQLWARIGEFIRDVCIICGATSLKCLPFKKRGPSLANGHPQRRNVSGPDDESRLMDQLDEEWDD